MALNRQFSSRTSIKAGVAQGPIFGALLSMIYIYDLSDDLITNGKIFANDTSLFSVVNDMNTSANNLN